MRKVMAPSCTAVTAYSAIGIGMSLEPLTEKQKVYRYFIDPLKDMGSHGGGDAFLCLMACFPFIETIIRHELKIPTKRDVSFSHGSRPLKWFAQFMQIREAHARDVWDALRNGLLHRALITGIEYEITGRGDGRPAQRVGDVTKIYIWDLRDCVVQKLEEHHRWLWKEGASKLPDVFVYLPPA